MSLDNQLDCIERILLEIDALEAIYDNEFSVLSRDALKLAKEQFNGENESMQQPILDVKIAICVDEKKKMMQLTFRIPEGYPLVSPVSVLSVVSPSRLSNAQREKLSVQLAAKAQEMIGAEAILEVVQYAQDLITDEYHINEETSMTVSVKKNDTHSNEEEEIVNSIMFSRRWIWVHHITNTSRRKDIIREAKERNLGGYLKAGYPGVVVIEGPCSSCEDFCVWIKGNKSRPGGFGRNWGHHVRGQIDFNDNETDRKFDSCFEELDDMKTLGELCKKHEVDDEFKEYILQHSSSSS